MGHKKGQVKMNSYPMRESNHILWHHIPYHLDVDQLTNWVEASLTKPLKLSGPKEPGFPAGRSWWLCLCQRGQANWRRHGPRWPMKKAEGKSKCIQLLQLAKLTVRPAFLLKQLPFLVYIKFYDWFGQVRMWICERQTKKIWETMIWKHLLCWTYKIKALSGQVGFSPLATGHKPWCVAGESHSSTHWGAAYIDKPAKAQAVSHNAWVENLIPLCIVDWHCTHLTSTHFDCRRWSNRVKREKWESKKLASCSGDKRNLRLEILPSQSWKSLEQGMWHKPWVPPSGWQAHAWSPLSRRQRVGLS
jgi:hypothetical protein